MYLQGDIPELVDAQTAAVGKLDIEIQELKPQTIMKDWAEYIKVQAMEHEDIAIKVREKGKSLKDA